MRNNYYKTKKVGGFDSKFERNKYLELTHMMKAKEIKDFKIQIPIDLIHNGYKVCTYNMDFVIYHLDNTIELLETKGKPEPVWSLKYKLLKAMYAHRDDIKITVEFQGKGREPKPTKVKKGFVQPI